MYYSSSEWNYERIQSGEFCWEEAIGGLTFFDDHLYYIGADNNIRDFSPTSDIALREANIDNSEDDVSSKPISSSFIVYPNPVNSSDILNIDLYNVSADFSNVILVDFTGSKVKQLDFVGKTHSIDISGLSSGLYTVIINNGDATMYQKVQIIR